MSKFMAGSCFDDKPLEVELWLPDDIQILNGEKPYLYFSIDDGECYGEWTGDALEIIKSAFLMDDDVEESNKKALIDWLEIWIKELRSNQ